MLDIGWSELLVIGIVALVVVGPKDLPMMFKTLGRFTARARGMAREFQRAMEQAADDSGVKDVANDLKKAAGPAASGLDTLKNAATKFEKWDPTRPVASAAKAAASVVMTPSAIPDPSAPAAPATATETLAAERAAQSEAAAVRAETLRAAPAAAPATVPTTPTTGEPGKDA